MERGTQLLRIDAERYILRGREEKKGKKKRPLY